MSEGDNDRFNDLMDRFGALVIGEALSITGGNRSRAAQMLGLSRPTLQAKIEKYHLFIKTEVKPSDRD